jgi:hypothetical protein
MADDRVDDDRRQEEPMPVAFVLEIPGMSTEIYDSVMDKLDMSASWPDGLHSHYAAKTSDGLFLFDIWDSAEDWQRHAETRLGPALAEVTGGNVPQLEPRFYPLHREEQR